jgi:hypothetical protein
MINFGKQQYLNMLKMIILNRSHPRLFDSEFYDLGTFRFPGKPDSYERDRINEYNDMILYLQISPPPALSVRAYDVEYRDIR